MEAISNVASGFIGLFQAGGETFVGWVTGIIPLFCRGQALDVLILDGVTQFCSIGKNRCAVQRKGQLSKDGKQFFSLS